MINARQRDIGPSNDSNPLKFHLANYTTRFTTIHSHAVRNETPSFEPGYLRTSEQSCAHGGSETMLPSERHHLQ